MTMLYESFRIFFFVYVGFSFIIAAALIVTSLLDDDSNHPDR